MGTLLKYIPLLLQFPPLTNKPKEPSIPDEVPGKLDICLSMSGSPMIEMLDAACDVLYLNKLPSYEGAWDKTVVSSIWKCLGTKYMIFPSRFCKLILLECSQYEKVIFL